MAHGKLITSVTQKGQATIPAKVREVLQIKAGDQVVFEIVGGKITLRKAEPFDYEYHGSLNKTLSEWNSKEDDEAYGDL
jgi:AbrB family looped-hinge helix DNA binding protein